MILSIPSMILDIQSNQYAIFLSLMISKANVAASESGDCCSASLTWPCVHTHTSFMIKIKIIQFCCAAYIVKVELELKKETEEEKKYIYIHINKQLLVDSDGKKQQTASA